MRFSGNAVRDGCESSCECWRLDMGSLEEWSVHLATDPSLKFREPFKPLVNKWYVSSNMYEKMNSIGVQI